MHRSLRRIICSCIAPHEFKSRTLTVASVDIIFSSTPYALRVSCKIDGFRSKNIYCLSNIMNNKTECELYCYSFPLLQVIGVFFLVSWYIYNPLVVHCVHQSIRTHYPFSSHSFPLHTCSSIPTPYLPSLRLWFMIHNFSFNLSICALHPFATISSSLQSTCASCLSIPHSFLFICLGSSFVCFHFRNDRKAGEREQR